MTERSTVERAPLQLTITALGANATEYYPDPLGKGQDRIGGTFLTEWVRAVTWADQAGTLTLEDSDDRSTWGTVGSAYTVSASTLKETGWVNLTKRYWRWKYVNGATLQTLFRLFEDKTSDSTSVVVTGTLPAFAATPTVDTELPAAVALADAAANPTTPTVGAALKVWNGTTWDNADGVNTGQLVVTPKGSSGSEVIGATGAAVPAGAVALGASDGTNLDMLRAIDSIAADGITAPTSGNLSVAAFMYADNNTTKDRWRNNTEGTLLASAARTAAATASLLTNYNAVGILVILDVTAASGTGGLQVKIRTRDNISSNPVQHNAAPTAITATGRYGYLVYPGASTAGTASNGFVNQSTAQAVGRSVDVHMDVGDASSYTYSLSYALVV